MADPWAWRSDMDAPQPRNYLQPTLKPGPAPSGYDRVFDAVYNYLGGTPDKRPVANALAGAFDVGTLGMATGAYDGARELATTGRPAALAMALMPGARVAVPVAKVAEKAAERGIRAFHGSPHDFDRFSLDKIGTGEGAQAYGHGLYFAENEGVAKSYRDALAVPTFKIPRGLSDEATENLKEISSAYGGKLSKSELDAVLRDKRSPWDQPDWIDEVQEFADSGRIVFNDNPGRMYEVNIKANPDDFLDWDKPIGEQSERVRSAIDRAGLTPYTVVDAAGNRLDMSRGMSKADAEKYAAAKNGTAIPKEDADFDAVRKAYGLGSQDKAASISSALREAGIPGVKYLDQGSRGAGEGSRNYVTFDESLIEILRKYGLMPPAVVGGAAALRPGEGREQ